MPNYVLLAIAHGVEFSKIQNDYAQPLIDRIKSYLTDEEKNYLIPAPYNYTVKTNLRQVAMFEATDKGLGNEELRRLKHTIGSDVTWSFIVAKDGKECFYTDFVKDLSLMIENYRKQYPRLKVICKGHSQGTQLFYSFFFDYPGFIDCFISMGSPISMNSGAYPEGGKLAENLGRWINFYQWMDFISSKMQGCPEPFSQEIANFVIDYQIPMEWWKILYRLPHSLCKAMLGVGLMGHISYWRNDFVAKIISDEVKRLIHLP